MPYISKAGLNNLKEYRYHGTDKSLVAYYIGQPFWRWAVSLLPYWMAPNLVTLIGLGGIALSYACVCSLAPNLDGYAGSPWPYVVASFLLFFYQTMDALDGKQARRTGTSSPLGELFDHGCDAVTCVLMALTLLTSLQMGAGPLSLFVMLNLVVPFFFAQWEEYHTGTMELGYVGVTEGQLVGMLVYALSAALGVDFWLGDLFALGGWTFRVHHIFALVSLGGNLATSLASFYNVAAHCARNGGGAKALSQALPMVMLVGAVCAWARASPADVLAEHPHLFLVTLGFLNCNLVGRVIVSRVCKQHFSSAQLVLVPIIAVAACVQWAPRHLVDACEYPALLLCTVHSIASYGIFALDVIASMCRHLNIRALSMTSDQLAHAKEAVFASKDK
jgi:ethanolaminephosphotransferase